MLEVGTPANKMLSTLHPFGSPPPPPLRSSSLPPPHVGLRRLSFLALLELCAHHRELDQSLAHLVKRGLHREPVLQTKLVSLFSRFGNLRYGTLLFDSVEEKADELYFSVLRGHSKHSTLQDTLSFFCAMKRAGVCPVVYSFAYLLKSCGDHSDLRRGREVHSQLIVHGFCFEVGAMTSVMSMYAKCRKIDEARKMFDRIPDRDLVAWNAIVAGYAQNGLAESALEMVLKLQDDGKRPDLVTLVSCLPACADIGSLRIGKSVHGFVVRTGLEFLVNISTALVDMYAKCGAIEMAELVFKRMQYKNVVSWNSMIDGYGKSGNAEEAMKMFKKMMAEGIEAKDATILGALYACGELGDLEEGKRIHDLLVRIGLASDASVMNALITMYSKCKRVDLATEVFENLEPKNLISWNAMILGCSQNNMVQDALRLFTRMLLENVKPDSFTMVSVIPAIAYVSVLQQAKWIHGLAIRLCLDQNVYVKTALIDLYSKCGGVIIARKLFDAMDDRHVTTWNAMIDGYGSNGLGNSAVLLFEEMKMSLVRPNDVTFLSVLSACSHSGLVDEGHKYFSSMKQEYGFEPGIDHYGSMVDLLGRAGRLDDAWKLIQRMPIKPSISVYGAMLGACKIHKNVELAEEAAAKLFELEPEEGGYHVLLANIYAIASMWKDVARVRAMMEKKGLQKTPGYSCIQLKSKIHTFYSGSTNHPQSKKIYTRLEHLIDAIKAVGYVPSTASLDDVEEDVRTQLLNTHSEKLAIAFALINTSPGTAIHIRKNLRVCTDCHNATKLISQVTGREIIVRDMQRFHHFKNGKCSCGDYW